MAYGPKEKGRHRCRPLMCAAEKLLLLALAACLGFRLGLGFDFRTGGGADGGGGSDFHVHLVFKFAGAAFNNAGRLTGEVTEVIELGTAHFATAHNLDRVD